MIHIDRPDWGAATDGPRETPGTALVPSTHSNGDHETSGVDQDDALATLDADDTAKYRRLLAEKTLTRDELGRFYGLTDAELDALSKPATRRGRATIDAELAEITELRKTNPRAYWKDDVQARQLALIEQKQAIAAKRADAHQDDDIRAGDLSRRDIDKELEEIAKHRRDSRKAYDRDPKMQQRELELLEAREQVKEIAAQTWRVRATVDAILDAVPDAEQFQASFDSLPESARAAIGRELAMPPEDPAKPASEAELIRFREGTPEGAELVKMWGRDAGRRLAILRTRLERFYMSGGDVEAASLWLDNLPSAQAKAVWRALAG